MENKKTLNDIVSNITNDIINEAYDKKINALTKYEKEIFYMCIDYSPNIYLTKGDKLKLISVIKKQKITKKTLTKL